MAEGGKKSDNKKGLLILLGVLCLAIVGLGVGIGVVLLRGGGNQDETIISCEGKETPYDVSLCVDEIYSETKEIDIPIEIFREAIANSEMQGDYIGAVYFIKSMSDFLTVNGYCDVAIRELDNGDYSSYTADSLAVLYSYALGTSMECGNSLAEEKYNDLLNKVSEEVQGGLGF